MHTQPDMRPRSTSTIIALITRSLSAIGSMNFPKFVTSPFLRAIWPSSASVIEARMNTATAAYCAAGALISARITNTGIMQILSMESLFGKFIYGNTFPVRSYASAPVIST